MNTENIRKTEIETKISRPEHAFLNGYRNTCSFSLKKVEIEFKDIEPKSATSFGSVCFIPKKKKNEPIACNRTASMERG